MAESFRSKINRSRHGNRRSSFEFLERRIVLDSTVVFNEIMYHPDPDESRLEWIELHNQMSVNMDLSGWKLDGGVDFEFAEGTVIDGQGYLVIAADPQYLGNQTGFSGALGPLQGSLSNGGEELRLLDNNIRTMNVVEYWDSGQWPVGPDGSGFTLAKQNPTGSSDAPENWATSSTPSGTPGAANFPGGFQDSLLVINELGSGGSSEFFMEIVNASTQGQSVSGYVIASSAGVEHVLPNTVLPAGGKLSVTAAELGFIPADGDRLYLFSPARNSLEDAQQVTGSLRGRSSQQNGRWFYPDSPTPAATNSFNFENDIVINEIFYHPLEKIATEVTLDLLTEGYEASVFIPSDDSLGDTWIQPTFNDTAWTTGPTGVGFEAGNAGSVLAYGNLTGAGGTANFNFSYGHDFVVNSTISVTHLGVFDSDANGLQRTLTAELWSRSGNTGSELKQLVFSPQDPGTLVASNRLKPLSAPLVLEPGSYSIVAHGYGSGEPAGYEAAGGPSSGFKTLEDGGGAITFVGNSRLGTSPGQFPSLPGGGSVNYYSAGTFQFDVEGDFGEVIGTDVESLMYGQNATAFLRLAFSATALTVNEIAQLTLKMKYDDGFVAYLNGVEVARRNAPDTVSWNSLATNIAPVNLDFEVINVSAHASNLLTGTNVLAIHGLNSDPSDGQFLIVPELQLTTQLKPGLESEWLELYNRGPVTVDLTEWQLDDGIQYTFESGTTIESENYLVVAKDAVAMASWHPGLAVVGNYSGNLSDKNDRIVLLDATDNLADEVKYFHDRPWSDLADGGGSSLELRNPFADNSQAAAWNPSDEASHSQWQTISETRTAAGYSGQHRTCSSTGGPPLNFHEFNIGMLDRGEVLLDDISVVDTVTGRELIQNGMFEADVIGNIPSKWRISGNHSGEVIQDPNNSSNQVLQLTARGPTGWVGNHAETTLINNTSIVVGRDYDVSFRAKWVEGSNLLNTRSYFDFIQATTPLNVPQSNGTPGVRNSVFEINIGPVHRDLHHSPVVPSAGESVIVSVVAEDPEGVNSSTLWWRTDGDLWNDVPMVAGTGGRYTGTIPGQSTSTDVQFYVESEDTHGAISFFPAAGPDSRALIKFDDGFANSASNLGVSSFRLIILNSETNLMHSSTNLMSADMLGATVVVNESEVFYDVGVRLKGSQHSRNTANRVGYNLEFHADQLFRGVHERIALDRSTRAANLPNPSPFEIVIKQFMNHAGGIVSEYDDITYVAAPSSSHSGPATLQMARMGAVYLDSQFENGSDSPLFEMSSIFVANNAGNPEALKSHTPGPLHDYDIEDIGDDKELYRWAFQKKNTRDTDEFGRLVEFNQAWSNSGVELDVALDDVMDVDQWMRAMAARSLIMDHDGFGTTTCRHNNNFMVYQRPDEKFIAILWDIDASFGQPLVSVTNPLYPRAGQNITKVIQRPQNLRLFYGHMQDMINTTWNINYMQPWMSHYGAKAGQSNAFLANLSKITQRNNHVLRLMPAQIPFAATSSDPLHVGSAQTATVEGTAWFNVREIRLAGGETPLDVTWKPSHGSNWVNMWEVTIPVTQGTHPYTFEAFDFQSASLGTTTININSTTPNLVVESLRITEVNYNPTDPTELELVAMSGLDNDDFEFIEVQNIGIQNINLYGVRFNDGIEYTFPAFILTPGEYGVIVRDAEAFALRYGSEVNVIGQFELGGLNNGGENLTLIDGQGRTVVSFSYNDDDLWPERADGVGGSLELIDPAGTSTAQWDKFYRWSGSTEYGGTPGTAGSGPVGVVINEVLVNTDPPVVESDSIELYNSTDAAMDISGWYLSDAAGDLLKYKIPDGTIISAGNYHVFDESDFNPTPQTPGPNDFALSGTRGDDVWLTIPDGNGGVTAFVDDVHFGSSANGESWGRTNGHGNRLSPMKSLTFGAQNSVARVGPLVIIEIHYHPVTPSSGALAIEPGLIDNDLEFIEIYNPTRLAVDLTDWRIRGGVRFDFAAGSVIAAGESRVVVSFDPNSFTNVDRTSAFRTHHGIDANIPLVGGFENGGQLNNSAEQVELQRPDTPHLSDPTFLPHLMEDEVLYDDLAPWPIEADNNGESLQRVRVDLLGKDATTWTHGHPSPGRFGPVELIRWSPTTSVIGETGEVTNVTHLSQTVTFSQAYSNPIVFAQPASMHGNDPVVVRATNVQPTGFDVFLAEPSDRNGTHGIGEVVNFLVLEAGNHILADGRQLEAGTVVTSATVGKIVTSPNWETVTYAIPFTAPPVLITQPQTSSGTAYLSSRQNAISADNFQFALQQEEMISSQHMAETVGYFAIESGTGIWNEMLYEAQSTAADFTDVFTALNFIQTFTMTPGFIASLNSYNGIDNAHLRYQHLQGASVELKIEEDTTQDTETAHLAAESIAYLAIGGEGLLTSIDTKISDGITQSFPVDVDITGQVADLNVTVELFHGQIEDLHLTLESPDGTFVELIREVSSDGNWLRETTFDDEASHPITSGGASFSGYYQPNGSLKDFDGQNTRGIWSLHITDATANNQSGTFIQWSLQMEFVTNPMGNLNHDGAVTAADIDLLFTNLGSTDPVFDVDVDGNVDRNDVDQLVLNVMETHFGDTDTDKDVDNLDFNNALMNYEPVGQINGKSWFMGNFDGDLDVDMSDLMKLVVNFSPDGDLSHDALYSNAGESNLSDVDFYMPASLSGQRAANDWITVNPMDGYHDFPSDLDPVVVLFSSDNEAAVRGLSANEYYRSITRRRREGQSGREQMNLDCVEGVPIHHAPG